MFFSGIAAIPSIPFSTDGTEARSRARGHISSPCIGELSALNGAAGQVFSIKPSRGPACRAMRASSGDTAGDCRTSGGARRSASTPLRTGSPHLHSAPQSKLTNTPPHHGRMREFEGKSKVTTKAKRAHAEIYRGPFLNFIGVEIMVRPPRLSATRQAWFLHRRGRYSHRRSLQRWRMPWSRRHIRPRCRRRRGCQGLQVGAPGNGPGLVLLRPCQRRRRPPWSRSSTLR